jgi:hypothetical protein
MLPNQAIASCKSGVHCQKLGSLTFHGCLACWHKSSYAF